MTDRVLSSIGLATKAGKAASGEFSTEKAIKEGNAYLVLIAEDASDNTKKHFHDMCNYRSIPYKVYGNKESLGHAMGKQTRASLAITDAGFANMIQKQLDL